VVAAVVPDLAPGGERAEHLTFPAPIGTTAFSVPTGLEFVARVGEAEHKPVDGVVRLPEPLAAGTPIRLEFTAVDGRRGGALLDGAVSVEVAEAATALVSWEELGLRALGGHVRYRTRFTAPSGRVVLDLGEVRGTADVTVNGRLVDRLVWGPWRVEVTDALRDGENELEVVVRGTLAGYLDDASPTTAVAAGQVRTGLFGPVRIAVS
jgi:acyl-coenzyme A thioesterase PaaI-like protein